MTGKTGSRKTALKWFLSFLIPALVFLIPLGGGYTSEMRTFLVLTVWAITMFILALIDNTITALVLVFGYAILGVIPLADALASWTTPTIWMVLTSLIILNVVKKTTLLERIAYWLIIRTGGTYLGILFGMGTLSILALLLVPSVMTGVAVCVVAVGVCNALGLEKGKASGGIVLTAIITFGEACNFIYSPSAVGVSSSMAAQVVPVTLDYITLIKHNWVFIPLIYVLCFIISKMMKPEVPIAAKEIFIEKRNALGKMKACEWRTLAVLIGIMLFLFTNQWHKIDMVYGFIFGTAIMFIPGFGMGTADDIKEINVGTLIFITSCMTIGTAGVSVGIGEVIANIVTPIMSGQSSLLLVGGSWLSGFLLNFLMTPMALIAVLSGPFAELSSQLGVSPFPTIYTIYFSGNNVILPYENTIYLIAFGFGLIHMKDFIRVNAVKVLVCFLWALLIGTGYWALIGLFG